MMQRYFYANEQHTVSQECVSRYMLSELDEPVLSLFIQILFNFYRYNTLRSF